MKLIPYLDEKTIQNRVVELSKELDNDYRNLEPVLLCVLKGAIFFACDLSKNLTIKHRLEFCQVSSYQGRQRSGNLRVNSWPITIKKNDNVIVVEDILDSGYTTNEIITRLEWQVAHSSQIKVCTLLNKTFNRKRKVLENYVGFNNIENKFLVGYGLDLNERYRNWKSIHVVK